MRIELPGSMRGQTYEFIGGQLTRTLTAFSNTVKHTELIARLDRGEVLEIGSEAGMVTSGWANPIDLAGQKLTFHPDCFAFHWRMSEHERARANTIDRAVVDWSQDAGPQP